METLYHIDWSIHERESRHVVTNVGFAAIASQADGWVTVRTVKLVYKPLPDLRNVIVDDRLPDDGVPAARGLDL